MFLKLSKEGNSFVLVELLRRKLAARISLLGRSLFVTRFLFQTSKSKYELIFADFTQNYNGDSVQLIINSSQSCCAGTFVQVIQLLNS